MVTPADVWQALGTVSDPELPVSIVEMGLVYDVRVARGPQGASIEVDMTFTALGCPAVEMIRGDIEEALDALDGVDRVRLNTVWDPPWTVARLSERARAALRLVGVGV